MYGPQHIPVAQLLRWRRFPEDDGVLSNKYATAESQLKLGNHSDGQLLNDTGKLLHRSRRRHPNLTRPSTQISLQTMHILFRNIVYNQCSGIGHPQSDLLNWFEAKGDGVVAHGAVVGHLSLEHSLFQRICAEPMSQEDAFLQQELAFAGPRRNLPQLLHQ